MIQLGMKHNVTWNKTVCVFLYQKKLCREYKVRLRVAKKRQSREQSDIKNDWLWVQNGTVRVLLLHIKHLHRYQKTEFFFSVFLKKQLLLYCDCHMLWRVVEKVEKMSSKLCQQCVEVVIGSLMLLSCVFYIIALCL